MGNPDFRGFLRGGEMAEVQQGPRTGSETDTAVTERYSAAAAAREAALCCPVDYDPQYLRVIPQEVLERDYGCGDPSRYVREGEIVLDLGSGAGKICFIAAQIVGPKGAVIGVDMNEEMLSLARESMPEVVEAIGFSNVQFHRGRIQDLALDPDAIDAWLADHPVRNVSELSALEEETARLRTAQPLIADESVDLVVSNCVLNLVRESDRRQLVEEIFRVLKVGGRIAISDIVSDEEVPENLKRDPELWSGCVSGAFQESAILQALEDAGFYGIAIDKWEEKPFAVVEGIEFRSVTITAHKGKEGVCLEGNEALIYRGPWKSVQDDDGHTLVRGERTAVCEKTFRILSGEPYRGETIQISPRDPVAENQKVEFDCGRDSQREPRETKGAEYHLTEKPGSSCC
jgi:ubiquinone/menaquinone biosynthesis C-methylase UbiE